MIIWFRFSCTDDNSYCVCVRARDYNFFSLIIRRDRNVTVYYVRYNVRTDNDDDDLVSHSVG